MKRVLIDMDDTICDYTGQLKYELEINPGQPFPQSQYGFFSKLKFMPGAKHAVEVLRDYFDVWFCTRCSSMNPMSYAEKAYWIKNNFGQNAVNKLIITPDKALIKADILIDDIRWHEFQGRQIVYHKEDNNWYKILKLMNDER